MMDPDAMVTDAAAPVLGDAEPDAEAPEPEPEAAPDPEPDPLVGEEPGTSVVAPTAVPPLPPLPPVSVAVALLPVTVVDTAA